MLNYRGGSKINNCKINLSLSLLFLVNPLLSLFPAMYLFFFGINTAIIIALSLSLILIYLPLLWDTSANFYTVYYQYDGFDISMYTYLPYYIKKIMNIDMEFMYFIYVYTVLFYYFWMNILITNFNSSVVEKKYKYTILIFLTLFTFDYGSIMGLNRNILSYSIFFYYLFVIKRRNSNPYIFLFISILLSVNLHVTSLLLWLIFFISKLVNINYKKAKLVFFTSALVGIILPNLIAYFPFLESSTLFGGKLAFYLFDERWGKTEELSLGVVLLRILNFIILLILSRIVICNLKKEKGNKNIFLNFAIFMISISMLSVNYTTFFERCILAVGFINCYLLLGFKGNKFEKYSIILGYCIKSMVLFLFIYSKVFFGNYSDVLPDTENKILMESKVLYYPTLMLFDIKDHGYSDEYIYKNSIWAK